MISTPPPPHPQGLPGNLATDFVGCSHSALLACFAAPWFDAKVFADALIGVIGKHGVTHNQRELLQVAFEAFRV